MVADRQRRKQIMPTKHYRSEEIIAKLREAEVLLGQGKKVPEVTKAIGISEVSYYRWRKEYGGLERLPSQAPQRPGAGERPPAQSGLRPHPRQAHPPGGVPGRSCRSSSPHCRNVVGLKRAKHLAGKVALEAAADRRHRRRAEEP